MHKYIEPTDTTFTNVEQSALDMLMTRYPALLTKPGSVVRELVVRPMAYLYAWSTDNIADIVEKASAAYLKTSQATDNELADAVASNYFITRKQGVYATGVISLQLSTSYLQLAANTAFSVDGNILVTPHRVIAMAGTANPGLRDGVMYVNMLNIGNSGVYQANIPVRAMEPGPLEISAGAAVVPQAQLPYMVAAMLTSPVTGGGGVETDAQLMARAEAATATGGIGSYFGIKKKLDNGPVKVLSFGLAGGEDSVLSRARFNNVNINPGGFVDCYVKTQNQLAALLVRCPVTGTEVDGAGVTWYKAEVPLTQDAYLLHGAVCPSGPLYPDGDTADPIVDYKVEWSSRSSRADGTGARLGIYQRLFVCFQEADVSSVDVNMLYMPGIYQLQQYMDAADNKFIGQSIEIKAAIPVTVSVSCAMSYDGEVSSEQLDNIKQALVDYINSTKVGCGKLNFSDMIAYCESSLPGASLRLPCTITAAMPLMDGSIDSLFSTTGILDLTTPASSYRWNPAICFFSAVKNNIRIEQI